MLYLNDADIRAVGFDWPALLDTADAALRLYDSGDYAQPIKPYLRFGPAKNRIIAMPAYIGGSQRVAGIKWIASFPDNIRVGLPRAHSVIVLNEADTGRPAALLHSPLPSIVRTAAVSGLIMQRYIESRPHQALRIGIIGWGPIGQHHARMAVSLFGSRIDSLRVFDLKRPDPAQLDEALRDRVQPADSWQVVYKDADIVFTCTASDSRYIDLPPKPGSLLMHVSLRDYKTPALAAVRAIIVDDWHEVCRENTDIEALHLETGLTRAGVRTLADVVCRDAMRSFAPAEPILFCPMGLGIFDIATAAFFVEQARRLGLGTELD